MAGDIPYFRMLDVALEEHFNISLHEREELDLQMRAVRKALKRGELTLDEVLLWRDEEAHELKRLVKITTTEHILLLDGHEELLGDLDAYWQSCKRAGF